MHIHNFFLELKYKPLEVDRKYRFKDIYVEITHKSIKFLDNEGQIISFGKRVDEPLWKMFATDITKLTVSESIEKVLDKIDELSEIYKSL